MVYGHVIGHVLIGPPFLPTLGLFSFLSLDSCTTIYSPFWTW